MLPKSSEILILFLDFCNCSSKKLWLLTCIRSMFYFQGMHVILVALQCSSLKSVCLFVCFFVYLCLCSVFLSVGISRVIVYASVFINECGYGCVFVCVCVCVVVCLCVSVLMYRVVKKRGILLCVPCDENKQAIYNVATCTCMSYCTLRRRFGSTCPVIVGPL